MASMGGKGGYLGRGLKWLFMCCCELWNGWSVVGSVCILCLLCCGCGELGEWEVMRGGDWELQIRVARDWLLVQAEKVIFFQILRASSPNLGERCFN